jgi:hypothetical protein
MQLKFKENAKKLLEDSNKMPKELVFLGKK